MSKRGLPSDLKMRHDVHFVDELVTRTGAPVGRMIPMEQLDINPDQPRIDVGDLDELMASIREKGVLEPILVKPNGNRPGFLIISGERRFRAAKQVGLREIPCIEMDVDERGVAEIALIENLQRKDLTPFEEANGLKVLVERFGYTHDQVSKKIGKSRTSVTEALSVAELPEEIRELCRRADIQSKSMLVQIARQGSVEAMRNIISKVKDEGADRDTIRRAGKSKPQRPRQYTFQHRTPEYQLLIRFRKADITRTHLAKCLRSLADDVELG
ncbi:MAG: ParB/RepB/Spo0J family partition protein [Acidobacteria bacterium]|nr:ParB/RepB/Spo0J family partition protein [Acidobacteriota bacterium]